MPSAHTLLGARLHGGLAATAHTSPEMCIGVRVCFTCLERQRDLGKLVVVERQVGNRVIVCGSDGRIVRIHRSEKLSRRLAKDEVGLSRALLGVGALELAVGVDVGRSVGARQGSHVVAVLGLEGNKQLVLELAPLRAARKWGPRSIHRNVGHGRHVREAARKVIVLPVLAGAVGLVVGAHVEHALVGRVYGGPSNRPHPVVKRGAAHGSVHCDSLTAHTRNVACERHVDA